MASSSSPSPVHIEGPWLFKRDNQPTKESHEADFTLSNPPSPKKFPFNCRLRSCTQGGDLKPPTR
ncbi:unnamed protein product [Spirodela intermedia]|uniref:Uncharacterized protein n=1 Tax=Spirodela intermedia TaxID=51605 RepID=A0A7I8I7H5_SPIIN|nr:unnamed protein product [Spirodela intermedia]CAA6653469.1 unnamed protein product [Spirodela intermedia]